ARRGRDRGGEVLDRRGAADAGLEVAVGGAPERGLAEQRVQQAHDLGALLVDGRGIEVVDLGVARRAHRMRERAGVLDELAALEQAHVLDPLERAAAPGRGELLVAEYGESVIERERD